MASVLQKLKPMYVGSCASGPQTIPFLELSNLSLVVGFVFSWNNLVKLAERRWSEPWAGSKEGQGGGGGKDRRGLCQPDAFQVLGGYSEDVADLFEVMNIIKEATMGRLVVFFFNATRPQGIH